MAIEKTILRMNNIREAVEVSARVINKLGERSEHIGKILTVIDEVTKQTNLFALNAAILAAQAGEQGKGFAVVAGEIKNLADRTASSTKEIAQLITSVQTEAKESAGGGDQNRFPERRGRRASGKRRKRCAGDEDPGKHKTLHHPWLGISNGPRRSRAKGIRQITEAMQRRSMG